MRQILPLAASSIITKEIKDMWFTIELMRMIPKIAGVRVLVLSMLVVAFSATAMAQCGGSFSTLAAAAASIRSQSKLLPSTPQPSVENRSAGEGGNAVNTSIVGLWHIS